VINLEKKLKEIINEQYYYPNGITNELSFLDDLKLDVVDLNALFCSIEADLAFNMDGAMEDFGYADIEIFIRKKVPTIQNLIDFIRANEGAYLFKEDAEREQVFDPQEYDGLLIDLRAITKDSSVLDLFERFNISDTEFRERDLNKRGFYRLATDRDKLEDIDFLGTDYINVNPILLKNEMMGVNYRDELEGDDIIQLYCKREVDKISVQCFPSSDHWQHHYWLHFVKIDPKI
jgi:acyl carrier protein